MTDTQVAFEDLIPENTDSETKKSSAKTRTSSKKSTAKKSKEKKASQKTSTAKKKAPKKTPKKTAAKPAAKTKKTASSKRTVKGKNAKVNVTQEDMDKLCEVYDWYLQVKDIDIVEVDKEFKKSSINIDDDIIKEKKRISSVVDEEIWDDFGRLCDNTGLKKGDVLTLAMKEFLLKHKDLI